LTLHNTTYNLTDTLEVASKLGKVHGITRNADVTQFSNVNLPVWVSLRPNAKCLSQSAGKGMCSDSALVSAIMEGIEVDVSENVNHLNACYLTTEESRNSKTSCINIDEHPLQACIPSSQKIPWLEGKCLRTEKTYLIPADMLSLDFTLTGNNMDRPRQFRTTSNGLASGRTYVEACVSGLLEVIERHSITLTNMLTGDLKKIVVENSCPPRLASVLEELDRQDINVNIYDSTVVGGVHAIEAFIWSPTGIVPPVHGFGCSLNLETAILRAVLEANQASTLLLSGSRDDLTKHTYLMTADAQRVASSFKRRVKLSVDLQRSDFSAPDLTPVEELASIINKVTNYLDREILVYRFTPEDYPVSVCKVLVPTMEGYLNAGYKPQHKLVGMKIQEDFSTGLKLAAGGRS
jgi:ribosomal protein S12 methylthiotransferase accessory factor